jgi:hypothetical protein
MTEYNRDRWPEEYTEVSIEKVEKYGETDDSFFTELRVLSGPQKGQLKRSLWFRTKRDGNPRKDTAALLRACSGDANAPSYKLKDKIVRLKPWYPGDAQYPYMGDIELIGEVTDDVTGPGNPVPDDAW